MPSALIHLQAGRLFSKNAPVEFFVGTLAPDCIKGREDKDRLHLRLSSDREKDLAGLAASWDMNDPFQLGTLLHLYTDWLWDVGPQERHRLSYTGETWFTDYRHEISLASCFMYHHAEWAPALFDEMDVCPETKISSLPDYPPEKITSYVLYTHDWVANHETPSSDFFTPAVIDDFCRDAAGKFKDFLKRNAL